MAKTPNYMKKILKKLKDRQLPVGVTDVLVRHDDWCDIYKGLPCNCDPEIEMKEMR